MDDPFSSCQSFPELLDEYGDEDADHATSGRARTAEQSPAGGELAEERRVEGLAFGGLAPVKVGLAKVLVDDD